MHAEVKILALMLLAVVFGCGDRMRQQRKTVMDSAVTLNLSAMERLQSDLSLVDGDTVGVDSGYRYVVYQDSSQCVSCSISHIGKWHRFAHLQDSTAVRFLFLFHPSSNDVSELRSLCGSVRYNIFLDSLGVFEHDNELLVKKFNARAFLLDGDNRIVFVGDPTKDLATQEAYLHVVDSLARNRETDKKHTK